MNKLLLKNNFKILKNYERKLNFTNFTKRAIYDSIEIISSSLIRKKIEKSGLENMHKYFSTDYLPFLQFLLHKKLKNLLYKQIFEVVRNSFKLKKDFYIDKTLNFRIHYPFEVTKKSSLSRSIYRSLNLKNFSSPDVEIKKSISKSRNYVMDKSDTTKIEYFGRLPVTSYLHSPHRDTWFGHSIQGLNLWWGITDVNIKNGLLLFRDIYEYNLKHLKQPAYVEDIYNLGKSVVPKLNAGDLLLFDPEILHATRLNTSDMTRIVFSGRIDFNKPRFYSKTFDIKEPYWLNSNDIKSNNFSVTKIFSRKKNYFKPIKRPFLKKSNVEFFYLNKDLKSNQTYKLFKIEKNNHKKVFKIKFNNVNVSLVLEKSKAFAFNSLCPHLKFDLTLGNIEKNKLTCQGHGLTFNINSGKSTCGLFKLRKYKILNKEGYYHLLT